MTTRPETPADRALALSIFAMKLRAYAEGRGDAPALEPDRAVTLLHAIEELMESRDDALAMARAFADWERSEAERAERHAAASSRAPVDLASALRDFPALARWQREILERGNRRGTLERAAAHELTALVAHVHGDTAALERARADADAVTRPRADAKAIA